VSLPPAREGGPFTYELIEKTPGQIFELHVRMGGTKKPGSLRDKLALTTNVEKQTTVDIPVHATIPERLDLQPKKITLYKPRSGATATKPKRNQEKVVRLTNYGKNPVKLLEATVDHPDITTTVTEREEGKSYIVKVVMPPDFEGTEKGNTLTLKTDDSQLPTLTVPISKPPVRKAQKPTLRPAEKMVGKSAPDFEVTTTAGKKCTGAGLKDAITVLDFFAPNCPHCKKQIPKMENVRKEYEEKGVRFVLVSQTMRNKRYTDEQVVDLVKGLGTQVELAIDHDNTVGPLFKATSFPTMVLVGKGGTIDAVNIGNAGDLETRMKKQLDAMIAGKPVPKFASTSPPPRKRPALEMLGKEAPAFSIDTVAGKKLSSSDFSKHAATVLNVVAPNCGFCKKQVPKVEKVRKEYEAKGVRFVNVAQKMMRKDYTQEEVVDVFKRAGSNLELAYDLKENKVGGLYKATSFPTMFVIGKNGKIEAVNIGAKNDLDTTLKSQLDTLIEGKSLLPAKGAKTQVSLKPAREPGRINVVPAGSRPKGGTREK
jgi:thiol-disulfide isomerase/thioredoxin